MLRRILAAGGAAVLSAGAASAADLPRRAAPPPVFTPVPVFTWTGAYFGVNAGYAFTEADTLRTTGIGALQTNVNNGLRRPNVPLPQDGFTAGGQVGYNYQFTPGSGFVIGLEADAAYTDLNRRRSETIFLPAFNPNLLTNSYRADLSFVGTVRGRIGYAFDRFLVYGTGGFAYGDVTQTVAFQTNAPVTYFGSRSRIETGYAYGGGVEYALPTDSFLNFLKSSAVTAKIEYLRYDLGSRNILVASTGAPLSPGVGYFTRFRTEGSLVRAGLNFKFGTF
ncbi:outer membrane protein [Methylobacterium nonmethylotrophicum]|uniref:Porin family protein n=1 Tax=Methylobacterium nonmethylotrophicum TaxID=1141884 RepID=A0A4Z0NSP7_9HYPH|nr:outer membrane beta-barrel protein [Methylobacterium nonmethylotrophicum]TGE00108.1 porin family protein [Methylobacterium nonmethylotrophicum]